MKFWSFSFGCRVNQAEKEKIDRELIFAGFIYSEDNPDVCIVNTCAVTGKAEKESGQFIRSIQRKYPHSKIIVTGCGATKWKKENNFFNEVNVLIDNSEKDNILNIILAMFPEKAKKEESSSEKDIFIRSGRTFIKIQDGCDKHCSYCIVPSLRGQPKSSKVVDIVKEINQLDSAIKEVILTAINTAAYGLDTNENLVQLINSVLSKTDVNRLSFGSIHPWSFNDQLLRCLEDVVGDKRFVNYFHVPIQSGSDNILKIMNRNYKSEEILEKLSYLRSLSDLVLIGTDIMVGFPGESDSDFKKTYQFLENSPVDKFHVFRFSLRKGTPAQLLVKQYEEPSEELKKKRAGILTELAEKKMDKFMGNHLDKTFKALFLVRKINGFQEVLLENQMEAYIKTDNDFSSEIKTVKIESLKDGKLFGKIIK